MATSVSSSSSVSTIGDDSKYASRSKATKRLNRPSPMSGTPKATINLLPQHGSFQPKILDLLDDVHVKIGRQTSAKSAPGPNNGYFDSKVLSRTHAEVWYEQGKVYIKDVKSSNGTFINGVRLSQEGEESAPVELNHNDVVEFGIDIMNEDGTVLYHKVACKVTIIILASAEGTTREAGPSNNNNNNNLGNVEYLQKRLSKPSTPSNSSDVGLDRVQNTTDFMPRSLYNSKDTINLDQLVQKLQVELQMATEAGSELRVLKSTVGNVERCMSKENLSQMTARIADLNRQLQQCKEQAASYLEKNRHQDLAMLSAQRELTRFRATIRKLESENTKLQQDNHSLQDIVDACRLDKDEETLGIRDQLLQQKQVTLDHEEENRKLHQQIQILEVRRNFPSNQPIGLQQALQIPSVQIMLAVFIPIFSVVQYLLLQ
ncbi:hypothetical protein INT43_002033 [Umbelopsis isabellina]|uniref:FHA domain-containing protein n=1 Tax=Mortierella isabellina TaxID=91625 RepID=A0A8H7UGM8_MORIS|nr:hypothetical protein INT43_002033 [Umbelopsis isabellina]